MKIRQQFTDSRKWYVRPRKLAPFRAVYLMEEIVVGIVTTTLAIALTTVGLSPQEGATNDRVELMEVNHFYDEHGKHVFDQVIFYDWCEKDCRYHVRAWRLLKKQAQLPARNWKHGDYVAVWQDGDLLRRVRAKSVRESWTQHDPELAEREFLPKEKRRDLAKLIGDRKRR